jgi:DNA polymerase
VEHTLARARKSGKAVWIDKEKRLGLQWPSADSFFIQLPSGRRITYREVEKDTYHGRLKGGGYGRVKFYGGALTGHIVQGTARDLMAYALVNLDRVGFELILTVHDEAVTLDGDLERFEGVMRTIPPWADGLPVDVECFRTPRYRK